MSYTLEKFIDKANKIHNNKYDYSKTIYKNIKENLSIHCPEHGEFTQTAEVHLRGAGCRLCANKKISLSKLFTQEKFEQLAKEKHNNKYSYKKTIYKDSLTKVIITCPEHGDFEQIPDYHIQGSGCSKCKSDKIRDMNISNKNEFIEKAMLIHGDRYNYDKTCYVNSKTKICITCSKHGDFWQIPNAHLCKQGCPICNASKGELIIESILKKHEINYIAQFRIPEVTSVLRYDFYLPDHNLLIEFHGRQHYEYIPYFHSNDEDNFLKQKTRDILKKDHAHRFKYRFLEFNYKHLKFMDETQFEKLFLRKISIP